MDSLDNIWDEPVELDHTTRSTSTASHLPLFLGDSDDDTTLQDAPQEADVDIDAMFADVENDDDPFSFKPLTSRLDTDSLRREAETRHKKQIPSLTPHPVMSSSPLRDAGDDDASKSKTADANNKGEKKGRRKPVTLDEGRLLGPVGFPKLIKDAKNFRTKGKGHEVTDLNRLLQVYGYWTHEMFPRTPFQDTVERVEKLCHSKRMHVALSVWRDETHGRKPEEDEVIDLTDTGNLPRDPTTVKAGSFDTPSPPSDGAAYVSSRPLSHPPSSETEMGADDDFDIDAIIRDEEARLARERGDSSPLVNPTTVDRGKEKGMDNDQGASMWEALDELQENSTHSGSSLNLHSNIDEDDAMWDELDAMQENNVNRSTHNLVDEDMWDIVREIENETLTSNNPPSNSPATRIDTTAVTISHGDEDDWDSVYV